MFKSQAPGRPYKSVHQGIGGRVFCFSCFGHGNPVMLMSGNINGLSVKVKFMLILGIDPGLEKTGWGLVLAEGSALSFRGCGVIKTMPAQPLPERLSILHRGLCRVIEQWRPDTAAVEETFVNKNPAAALKLGQARGVALAVPAIHGLQVAEYSANKVKKSVVGVGHAGKDQVGMMVRMLLPACGVVSADEADALAVAITHAHHSRIKIRSMVSS